MKQLHLWITDEQSKELERYPNKAEAVRKAIDLYNGDITTDTIQGLRQSYTLLLKTITGRFDYYDDCFKRLDKLLATLETRM